MEINHVLNHSSSLFDATGTEACASKQPKLLHTILTVDYSSSEHTMYRHRSNFRGSFINQFTVTVIARRRLQHDWLAAVGLSARLHCDWFGHHRHRLAVVACSQVVHFKITLAPNTTNV